MAEKKLSEELRHCLEDNSCGDCQYHKPETKFTCKGLLQKAYERIKEYEDLEEQGKLLKIPCNVGDKMYLPNQYVKMITEFEIIEIQIFKDEIVFVDDSDNEWTNGNIGNQVFLTRPEAERALAEMEGKK